jgi:3-deoxy-D-manno-octulosonic-acid transferase
MMCLYNALWLLCLPAVVALLRVRRLLSGKYRRNLGPRLGFGPAIPRKSSKRPAIWVHALSVGEVLSALPLTHTLRQAYPDHELFFSTSTESGHTLACQRLRSLDCEPFYLPLDIWWAVRRVVKSVGASIFVLVETDIWPNLLHYLHRESVPIVLVNGRISDRSLARYRRVRSFVGPALRRLTVACMQSEEDGRRLRLLGIEPFKVRVTGSLKFDHGSRRLPGQERAELLREVTWKPRRFTWIAGSTHAGEEVSILRVYGELRRRFSDFCLILAPRHPERFDEAVRLAEQRGWTTLRRSKLRPETGRGHDADVLVLDTIGELAQFYSLGTFAFLGGSLVPAGGHNPLEAVQRGLPVVFGPHMENFRDIARVLVQSGGGFQVHDEAGMLEQVRGWLSAPETCVAQGAKAQAALLSHQGALDRTMEVIRQVLPTTSAQ